MKIFLLKKLYTENFKHALNSWEKQVKEEDIDLKSSTIEITFNDGSPDPITWNMPIIPDLQLPDHLGGNEINENLKKLNNNILDVVEKISKNKGKN